MIKISLIGDIFPGELAFTRNYGIRSQFNQHAGMPWVDKIITILGKNDLVIGNLESPLIEKEDAIKETFFGEPGFAVFLKKCGINILNVANNHILEHGSAGFDSTIKILSQNDLDFVGNVEINKTKILYKEIQGVKIAIAGFSNVDLHKIQNNNNFAVLNEENVLDTLDIMKQNSADIRILCLHWGDEYIHFPSLEQRKMAYKFIDAGASIIAGHHPHVIQPYEKYQEGHIFYSLGNFMFDFLKSKMVRTGLVVHVSVKEDLSIEVEYDGVQLSYNQLVRKIDKRGFERYYSRIVTGYSMFKQLPDNLYEIKYRKMHNYNHKMQRLIMKTHILKEFLMVSWRDKLCLVKNVVNYYYLIFKRDVR